MTRLNASVLIIESDPPTLELYRRELSREYRVLACSTEEEALNKAGEADICAVVMEPETGSGQGWLLLSALLKKFANRHIPIILCSTQDERIRGIKAGAAAFLVKPVLPFELREMLHKVVG